MVYLPCLHQHLQTKTQVAEWSQNLARILRVRHAPQLIMILWLKDNVAQLGHLDSVHGRRATKGYEDGCAFGWGLDVLARIDDCTMNRNETRYNVC
jgi:hypothetical protein